MKQLIVIFFFITSFSSLLAQSEHGKSCIGFQFRLKYSLQKDEVFSRVPRKSLMYGLELNYTYYTGFKMYRIELGANAGTLKTLTNANIEGQEITGFVSFTNLYKIKSANERFSYWYGVKLKFNFDVMPSDDNDALRYGWDALLSMNPAIRIDYAVSQKMILNYETDMNMAGILWRPNAQGYTLKTEELLETKGMLAALFENPRFSSVHNTLTWNNKFIFNYLIAKNAMLQAIYEFNYVNINVPRNKRSLSSEYKMGFKYKF